MRGRWNSSAPNAIHRQGEKSGRRTMYIGIGGIIILLLILWALGVI